MTRYRIREEQSAVSIDLTEVGAHTLRFSRARRYQISRPHATFAAAHERHGIDHPNSAEAGATRPNWRDLL